MAFITQSILMRQKEKMAQQSKDILMNNLTLAEQADTLDEQKEKIESRDRLIAEKDEKLDSITLKLNDVETLMDGVADIAYEKAVDAITSEVIIETQNQDIARLDSVRKWVEDPNIKRSKAERAFGITVLDNASTYLKKGIDRIIAAVKKKFLRTEVKKQKTEEIKREACPSIIAYLRQPRPETQKQAEQDQPTKKKSYEVDR